MKKTSLNKAVALSTTIMMVAFFAAPALTLAADEHNGLSPESDDIIVNLTVNDAITLSSPSDVTMDEITGDGVSDGAATWNVRTNNSDGYKLEVNASAAPAMANSTDNFADYAEAVPGTPESWSVDAADSAFGFSAAGDDVDAAWLAGSAYVGFPRRNSDRGCFERYIHCGWRNGHHCYL